MGGIPYKECVGVGRVGARLGGRPICAGSEVMCRVITRLFTERGTLKKE